MSGGAPLRAGVVGVGSLGQHHARIYAELPGTRLVGVVDADRRRAQEIAARHGARVFPDPGAPAAEIDLATVATPTTAHESAALPLIEAGVPVLVEKPIAADVAAAERLIAAAGSRGLPLMVGHTERFNPAVAALIERAGDPRFIEIHRPAPFVPRSLDVAVSRERQLPDPDRCRARPGGAPGASCTAGCHRALAEEARAALAALERGEGFEPSI